MFEKLLGMNGRKIVKYKNGKYGIHSSILWLFWIEKPYVFVDIESAKEHLIEEKSERKGLKIVEEHIFKKL